MVQGSTVLPRVPGLSGPQVPFWYLCMSGSSRFSRDIFLIGGSAGLFFVEFSVLSVPASSHSLEKSVQGVPCLLLNVNLWQPQGARDTQFHKSKLVYKSWEVLLSLWKQLCDVFSGSGERFVKKELMLWWCHQGDFLGMKFENHEHA